MIKVCLVVNALLFGGVEQVIDNYLSGFSDKDFSFTIIAQEGSSVDNISYFKSKGFNVELVTHKRKNWLKNAKEIKKILKNGNFDIVHSHMSFTNFYVLKIAKKLGIKIRINHYHNVFNFKGAKALFVSLCNKFCDKYATCNIYCSNEVKKYFGKTKKESFILHNAIDIHKFEYNEIIRNEIRKEYTINDDTIVVGHVGRFAEQKNHDFLVDIFNAYHQINKDSILLLCGDGPKIEIIKKKVEMFNLSSDVIFVGATQVPYHYYQAMDCFVFPSLFEGLGMTFLEAQISGLKCIGSDIIPDECIVSDRTIRLSLNDFLSCWVSEIPLSNNNSHSCVFNSQVDTYDLDKCKNILFDYYKDTVSRIK